MADVAVIDQFLAIFTQYIDSGFGLISGDVAFLVTVLIGVDGTLAGVAWALGEDEVLVQLAKKVLYVGLFAFFLNNWNQLAGVVFNSFAALGLRAAGSQLSYADFLQPGRLAHTGVDAAHVLLASMTVGGLALYAPRIASGIVSGAPQLGLGAAAAPAGVVAGTVVLGAGGIAAANRRAASGARAAASLAGGTRAAYVLGSTA